MFDPSMLPEPGADRRSNQQTVFLTKRSAAKLAELAKSRGEPPGRVAGRILEVALGSDSEAA